LLVVFFRTGSGSMLKMMGGAPDTGENTSAENTSGHEHTSHDGQANPPTDSSNHHQP
jgi:hypothetical protein